MAALSFTCNDCQKQCEIDSVCVYCEQLYCKDCTQYHRKLKATRTHTLIDASHNEADFTKSTIDIQCGNDCSESAISLCLDCKQVLCDNCTRRHSTIKSLKCHNLIAAKLHDSHDTVSLTSDAHSERHERRSSMHTEMSHAQVKVKKGPFQGMYANEFMSSAPGDKEVTRVRGIAIISDGKTWCIIVADYKNKSLKLFDENYQFVMAKKLKEDPCGMTAISNSRVAVTIADKKEIRFYHVDNFKIKSPAKIKIKEKPFSIAFNKDYLAVETGEGEDGAIRILDIISGKELRVISGNTHNFGRFTGNTIRLALNSKKMVVFVVDIAKEEVHCVDFNGTLNWTVRVKSPRGISLHDDVLFLASRDVNQIYQMSALDGTLYRMLDEDDRVKRPRYIAYNADQKKLAVEIDGNHIKVYNIDRTSSRK